MKNEHLKEGAIFKRGAENPFGEYFDGQSYLEMLTTKGVSIGNVTFEPGCRNHWHIHKSDEGGGQILLVTGGIGWYQEWGKEPRKLISWCNLSCKRKTLAWCK